MYDGVVSGQLMFVGSVSIRGTEDYIDLAACLDGESPKCCQCGRAWQEGSL